MSAINGELHASSMFRAVVCFAETTRYSKTVSVIKQGCKTDVKVGVLYSTLNYFCLVF